MDYQPVPYDASTPEKYISTRLDDQINWYSRKSGLLKRRYRWLKGATIVIGGLIPVWVALSDSHLNWAWLKYIAGVSGAVITIMEGISGMLKDKDTFLAYRAASETLIQEKMQYQSQSGKYAGANNPFIVFVEAAEGIMAGENAKWVNVQQQPDSNKGGDGQQQGGQG